MNPADIAAGYLSVLAQRAATAPRDFALLETTLVWGLGASAAAFLLASIVRRSASAAVAFSLLTLTGLIVGIAGGRLGFLPIGTAVLVLSLYACAVLLFLTACVRVARDNPVIGAAVLVAILALVALGGASALSLIGGVDPIGWALLGIAAFAVGVVLFDVVRGDRAAVAMLPGVSVAALSPAAMIIAGPGAPWWQVALPLQMLAGGTLLAAVTAMFIAAPAAAPRTKKVRRGLAPSYADDAAFFGEVDDHQPQHRSMPPIGVDAREPTPTAVAMPSAPPASSHRPMGTPLFAPAVTGGPAELSAKGSYEPEPLSAADPASSRWGGTDTVVPRAQAAADEYVWDAMAVPEVRAGKDALRTFGAEHADDLPPESLRDALASHSLDVFDELVLGGPDPRSGPFRADLALANGAGVVLDGSRQVDPDGILSRLSATVSPGQARASAAPLTARSRDGSGIEAALERGEIGAHFQPIVKLAGRETVGFEALARWTKPSGEVVDAQRFIPEVIEAGLGLTLAERIAFEAGRELAAWLAAQPGQGQFVSINIAATDLDKKGLSALIARVVAEHSLPPGALVVELGEDRIKASSGAAMAAAKSVRQAGASLAVDDFGVGFSNLSRLSKYRFDIVKTDQSLARSAANDKKARKILRDVVAIAHKAKMPVIAEGVEDEETARLLEELGCDFGQGYLFGRPEPAGGAADVAPGRQAASALR